MMLTIQERQSLTEDVQVVLKEWGFSTQKEQIVVLAQVMSELATSLALTHQGQKTPQG